MGRADLNAFVARARALADSPSPSTVAETRSWFVEPLLSTLGWNVRSSDCDSDVEVDGLEFEYVLSIDEVPAVFVFVGSYDDPLNDERETEIGRRMESTGVDRAIYTNGRELRLLAGNDGTDRFRCAITDVDEYPRSLEHVSEPSVRRRLSQYSEALVGRRLAVSRQQLSDSIATVLTEATDEAYEARFRTEAEAFVADLVSSLSTASSPGAALENRRRASGEPREDRFEAAPSTDRPVDGSADSGETHPRPELSEPSASKAPGVDFDETADEKRVSDDHAADTNTDERTSDGEYVVRFFDDRASIGAVGHSRSDTALVEATEFLFDRGLTGIRLPWAPKPGETVLNDRPVRADGTPMDAHRTLPNGCVLDTSGGVEDHAARLEALASRTGVRVMLTGDWSSPE